MLQATSISKSFFGVRVLSDFSIAVNAGEVHALLGHNGSGKSTLIKILSGYYHPDPGSGPITVGGEAMRPGDSASSLALGIRVVHQGLGLIPALTVLENLRMGLGTYATTWAKRIRWRDERARASRELARLGLGRISPDAVVARLGPVEQTGVAIVRALHHTDVELRCLILDEPTGALPQSEVDRLLGLIAELRTQGVAVMYVTHRLDEVPKVAQAVTVLRDGRIVGAGPIADFDQRDLIRLIVGEDSGGQSTNPAVHPSGVGRDGAGRRASTPGGPAGRTLRLSGITAGSLRDFSFTAVPGEVVGVISLVGAGVTDIPRLLRGDEAAEGQILLDDVPVTIRSPHDGQRQGVYVVPSTMAEKIIESLSVRENLTLGMLRRFWSHGHVSTRAEKAFVRRVIADFTIRCPSMEADVKLLSGGNKQKVVMGRALHLLPKVLVVEEPTNGVDVAGKKDILALLMSAAHGGMTVVICSSDIDDMVGGCTRIVVLGDGKAQRELSSHELSRERILTEVHAYVS